MAKTYSPPFGQTLKYASVTLTAAVTARDGSGSITTLATIGSNDGVVKRIRAIPAQATAAATTAKVLLLFISTDGGSTWKFWREKAMPTSTPSATAEGTNSTVEINFPDGFGLDTTFKIGCCITVYSGVQDRTEVQCEYIDY